MDAILHRREDSVWERFFDSPSFFLAQNLYSFYQTRRNHYQKPAAEATVRVVCVSDTHNYHDNISPLPDGDILIHAGDLTQSGTTKELERVLNWLSLQPHKYKLFIAGNHDRALADPSVVARLLAEHPDLVYLQQSETTLDIRGRTLSVYGSPMTPQFGSWAFQYPRIPKAQAATSDRWSSIPLHTDILITHGPPAYHLDSGGTGCSALLQALWRVRPRLHVFGHIHEARGVECLEWTPIQRMYERNGEKHGGWWDLVVMFVSLVRYCITGGGTGGRSTLVNASVLRGYRDQNPAIVVDI